MDWFSEALAVVIRFAQLPEVTLSRKDFNSMSEYSCTVPTGVTFGKRWKCNVHARQPYNIAPAWLLGEYQPSDTHPETHYKTVWSRIIVSE